MQIRVKYFAQVREALGVDEETLTLPDGVTTLGDVRVWLCARGDIWADALGTGRAVCMACDYVMSDASAHVSSGCEVAFFPPVTGG
jgi:molybdopterin synthase sulfur carrier subunit